MRKSDWRYWIFQILGWGGWILLNVFFVYLFAQEYFQGDRGNLFLKVLFIEYFWYILATHLLRTVLKNISWIQLAINKVILVFIVGVFITGLLSYYGAKQTAEWTNSSLVTFEKQESLNKAILLEKDYNLNGEYYKEFTGPVSDSTNLKNSQKIRQNTGWYRNDSGKWTYEDPRRGRFWWDLTFNFILIALWLLIYMVWHYLLRNQKDKVDRLQLEKTVKDLELKTIKSHINPHFIFNSLNSIRALVEENPKRARTAITELSNILRSSLRMEKMETVPLEKELSIVKDYLALEQMRFEERLQVNFDIDEDTLHQPIPPMMLQTLVENAIKHGISKQIDGGVINIISKYNKQNFQLLVQNTGRIEGEVEGFGIKSTRNRLQFLHNGHSTFKISNLHDNMVQVMIVMPLV